MKVLGAQLYSVKEECEADFMGTLEKISKMGYKTVEFAGLYGNNPSIIRKKLDELGLKAISAHISLKLLTSNLDEEISKLKVLGADYIICPWAEIYTVKDAKKHAKIFNEIGFKCREAGLVFAYHNHAHELVDDNGLRPLDVLFDEVDIQYVKQEADVYWLAYGGVEPIKYIRDNKDRMAIIHLKQMLSSKDNANVQAKDGVIDFVKIMDIAVDAKFIYEQEHYKGERFEEMKNSFEFIMKTHL